MESQVIVYFHKLATIHTNKGQNKKNGFCTTFSINRAPTQDEAPKKMEVTKANHFLITKRKSYKKLKEETSKIHQKDRYSSHKGYWNTPKN